jgi:hypothetical protein
MAVHRLRTIGLASEHPTRHRTEAPSEVAKLGGERRWDGDDRFVSPFVSVGPPTDGEFLMEVDVLPPELADRAIRELERALGRKTMENEILRAAQEEIKKRPGSYGASKR